jgi:adenylate cyclase class 2
MGRKLEQEVKFHLNNLESFQAKLQTAGARLVQPRVFESNLRFDTPDCRLSARFQVLRLRQDSVCRLTWKNTGEPGGEVSAREELEITVSDLPTARGILEGLGFEVVFIYEKYRSAWDLHGSEISVDEMPFGLFCEIEGPNIAAIRSTAEALDLNWDKRSTLSYLALFNNLKTAKHLEMRDMTFDTFRDINLIGYDFGF